MNRMILVFGILLFFIMCSKEFEPMDVEKMGAIVADLHIAEIAISREDEIVQDSLFDVFQSKILEIHHISKEELNWQLMYLTKNPKRNEVVYKWANAVLSELEQDAKVKSY